MAQLATYQNEANSIYDPQLTAELIQANQKSKDQLVNIDQEQQTVEPAYQTALRGLKDQTLQNEGKINQLYNSRLGGNFSGLQANDAGMMYSKAGQQRADIETSRANKLSSFAQRRTQVLSDDAATATALKSRYGGMKNQYAITGYQNAVTQEQKLAASRSRVTKPTASETTNSSKNALMEDINNAFASKDAKTPYFTEQTVLPALYKAYGALGSDYISKQVYNTRKALWSH